MPRAALAGVLLALLPACASSVYVDARVIGLAGDAAALAALREVRLVWDPDSSDPLRDRVVSELAARELAARGIALHDGASAELRARASLEAHERVVPAHTRVIHHAHPIRRWACAVDSSGRSRWVPVYDPFGWEAELWAVPERRFTDYVHAAELVLRTRDGAILWMGEARAAGRTGDFRRVMESCIPLLFGEYPAPSGQPAERRIVLPAEGTPRQGEDEEQAAAIREFVARARMDLLPE